jgi:Uma2 family endonuclease
VDMSTKSAVSLEEYLRTSFENPDREYVDGEIVERPLPDKLHSRVVSRLAWLVENLAQTRPFFSHVDLRSRVAATRVRIPDISVYAECEPAEDVPSEPPLIAIEVLSQDDRYVSLMEKFGEYKDWGVLYIWLIDPRTRELHQYGDGSLRKIAMLEIPEYDVRITPAEIFG